MRIDINQKKIALTSEYRIFTNGNETHFARKRIFSFLSVIDLTDLEHDRVVLSLRQKFAFFYSRYQIVRGERKLLFTTRALWKPVYECQNGVDTYEIIAHRRRRYSIFKNRRQVAYWEKEAVSWFAGDNYAIHLNDDADSELIIAFCLALDNTKRNDKDGNMVTYDFGNLLEKQPFDQNWQPNQQTS